MASNLKKAGETIRKSFRTRSYTMFQKENVNYLDSPTWRKRRSLNDSVGYDVNLVEEVDETPVSQDQEVKALKRGTSVTQSMREAVGTLRQKLRMSTRRRLRLKENQGTPSSASKKRHSRGVQKRSNRDVVMSSPFKIDTPTRKRNEIRTCLTMMETPTRLTREVEALTANMQALSSLTPNSLQRRSQRRRSPPLTNGSLKTPRSMRRCVTTDIY